MFWSGETIQSRLPQLIFSEDGSSIGNPDNIDCAAYTLSIGPQVFITPSKPSEKEKGHQRIKLDAKEDFVIPKGQFAFLLTEEFVKIPNDTIAFISLKTKALKFMGLINVSGFHVDPGFYGRIIFSVFNAGPTDITLHRGKLFSMIWFASLDRETKRTYKHSEKQNIDIPTEITGMMNGLVFSPVVIKERMEQLENRMRENEHTIKIWAIGILLAITIGTILNFFGGKLNELYQGVTTHAATPQTMILNGNDKPLSIQLDVNDKSNNTTQTPPAKKP